MIKVKDQFGNEISGLYRGKNGSLIVVDDQSFTRYKKQRQQIDQTRSKIESLEAELHEMKRIVLELLKTNEKSK